MAAKFYPFYEQYLTAAEISLVSGLPVKLIRQRLSRGMRDAALVAPARAYVAQADALAMLSDAQEAQRMRVESLPQEAEEYIGAVKNIVNERQTSEAVAYVDDPKNDPANWSNVPTQADWDKWDRMQKLAAEAELNGT